MTIVAVIGFLFLLLLAQQIAAPLGMAGGFLLGAVNASARRGNARALIQQSISYAGTFTVKDVLDSFGHYFWDVIGVGFVLWLPLMALDMVTQQNPNGLTDLLRGDVADLYPAESCAGNHLPSAA